MWLNICALTLHLVPSEFPYTSNEENFHKFFLQCSAPYSILTFLPRNCCTEPLFVNLLRSPRIDFRLHRLTESAPRNRFLAPLTFTGSVQQILGRKVLGGGFPYKMYKILVLFLSSWCWNSERERQHTYILYVLCAGFMQMQNAHGDWLRQAKSQIWDLQPRGMWTL